MAEQVILRMEPEELARWKASRSTKKVLRFLEAKRAEAVEDWTSANFPQNSLEEVGEWTMRLMERQAAYNHLLHLENFLPQDQCADEEKEG